MNKCKIVHCKKEKYDIYIGRPSKWGNPYSHKLGKYIDIDHVCSSRQEAIEKYKEYFLNNNYLISCLEELKGKTLGCWCKQKKCHGDFLAEIVDKLFN